MASLKLSTVQTLLQNSSMTQPEKDAALAAALKAAEVPDTWIYRIVVIALGLAIFIPLIAVLFKDKDTAQLLLPLATGALGALAGLLAPSPTGG
jgi:hypothetical protein